MVVLEKFVLWIKKRGGFCRVLLPRRGQQKKAMDLESKSWRLVAAKRAQKKEGATPQLYTPHLSPNTYIVNRNQYRFIVNAGVLSKRIFIQIQFTLPRFFKIVALMSFHNDQRPWEKTSRPQK